MINRKQPEGLPWRISSWIYAAAGLFIIAIAQGVSWISLSAALLHRTFLWPLKKLFKLWKLPLFFDLLDTFPGTAGNKVARLLDILQ
jgi:hypothetical protein